MSSKAPHEEKVAGHTHTVGPAQPTQPTETPRKAVTYGKHATMPLLQQDLYADVQLPSLNEFKPGDIKLDGTLVAVGKRRTGHSVMKDLMKDKIPAGIVISQTDPLNKFLAAVCAKEVHLP
eukprot:5421906-Prymnesium_polylepis.1